MCRRLCRDTSRDPLFEAACSELYELATSELAKNEADGQSFYHRTLRFATCEHIREFEQLNRWADLTKTVRTEERKLCAAQGRPVHGQVAMQFRLFESDPASAPSKSKGKNKCSDADAAPLNAAFELKLDLLRQAFAARLATENVAMRFEVSGLQCEGSDFRGFDIMAFQLEPS